MDAKNTNPSRSFHRGDHINIFSLIYYYLVNKKNKNGGINHDKEF